MIEVYFDVITWKKLRERNLQLNEIGSSSTLNAHSCKFVFNNSLNSWGRRREQGGSTQGKFEALLKISLFLHLGRWKTLFDLRKNSYNSKVKLTPRQPLSLSPSFSLFLFLSLSLKRQGHIRRQSTVFYDCCDYSHIPYLCLCTHTHAVKCLCMCLCVSGH